MKEASTVRKSLARVIGVMALFACATTDTAYAETITKTFEFGAGTALTRST